MKERDKEWLDEWQREKEWVWLVVWMREKEWMRVVWWMTERERVGVSGWWMRERGEKRVWMFGWIKKKKSWCINEREKQSGEWVTEWVGEWVCRSVDEWKGVAERESGRWINKRERVNTYLFLTTKMTFQVDKSCCRQNTNVPISIPYSLLGHKDTIVKNWEEGLAPANLSKLVLLRYIPVCSLTQTGGVAVYQICFRLWFCTNITPCIYIFVWTNIA